jgi:predicted DCC family thiol-disulfide oxidoreductase YuxK
MDSAMQPVILFDGVCHLCHAAVRWVIDRDAKGVFRFASLQSEAAREVLQGVGELPDSVVLVDEEGVHTRSEAAMRIARRLGFPYSLVALGRLMPGFLRDRVYGWVARNRYGWFGRMDSCKVPTAELAWRFLDAEEKIVVPELAAAAPPLEGWLTRSIWLYILLVIIPTPQVIGHKLYPWLAANVVGIPVTIYSNGRGDWNYIGVETGFEILVALVAGCFWRWRLPDWFGGVIHAMLRYFLGMIMLMYGWGKLIPLQMEMPGPAELLRTYAGSTKMSLFWTTVGASMEYQMFLGVVEIVVGLLLLFPSTALMGAIGCGLVCLQLVAVNYSYEIGVLWNSTHFLLMSCYLVFPHIPRIVAFLALEISAVPPAVTRFHLPGKKWPWVGFALRGAIFVGMMCVLPGYLFMEWRAREDARTRAVFHGYYFLDVNDKGTNPYRWARVAFSSDQKMTYVSSSGFFYTTTVKHNLGARTIEILFMKGPVTYQYSMPSANLLQLEKGPQKILLKKDPYTVGLLPPWRPKG